MTKSMTHYSIQALRPSNSRNYLHNTEEELLLNFVLLLNKNINKLIDKFKNILYIIY